MKKEFILFFLCTQVVHAASKETTVNPSLFKVPAINYYPSKQPAQIDQISPAQQPTPASLSESPSPQQVSSPAFAVSPLQLEQPGSAVCQPRPTRYKALPNLQPLDSPTLSPSYKPVIVHERAHRERTTQISARPKYTQKKVESSVVQPSVLHERYSYDSSPEFYLPPQDRAQRINRSQEPKIYEKEYNSKQEAEADGWKFDSNNRFKIGERTIAPVQIEDRTKFLPGQVIVKFKKEIWESRDYSKPPVTYQLTGKDVDLERYAPEDLGKHAVAVKLFEDNQKKYRESRGDE